MNDALASLVTDAHLLSDIVEDIAQDVEACKGDEDGPTKIKVREVIAACQAMLLGARQDLETDIGQVIGPDFIDVDGKRYSRHARLSLRNGDNEALVRAVLDSRRVNKDTGEVIEETPVDRLRHVWHLAARDARKTALKDRGLDLTEFVESEFRGWNITEDR